MNMEDVMARFPETTASDWTSYRTADGASFVHRSAVVEGAITFDNSVIGPGAAVFAGGVATLTNVHVGRLTSIRNSAESLRNVTFGDNSVSSAGVYLGMNVSVGNNVVIGRGAGVDAGVNIGDGATIAAHHYVKEDVPPMKLVLTPHYKTVLLEKLHAILNAYPAEAAHVRRAVVEGRIDGRTYGMTDSNCGCLMAHIAKARGQASAMSLPEIDGGSALEIFVWPLRPGMTHENNAACAALLEWIDAWQKES
jgi:carbonic anhydrase/acetyltransferase-like protein (isoleucine patch superfamily)